MLLLGSRECVKEKMIEHIREGVADASHQFGEVAGLRHAWAGVDLVEEDALFCKEEIYAGIPVCLDRKEGFPGIAPDSLGSLFLCR